MSKPVRDWSFFLLPAAALMAPAYASGLLSVTQSQTLLFPSVKSFLEQPLKLNEEQRDRIKALSGLRQRWGGKSGAPSATAVCSVGILSTM